MKSEKSGFSRAIAVIPVAIQPGAIALT